MSLKISILLVVNGTSLNRVKALLALSFIAFTVCINVITLSYKQWVNINLTPVVWIWALWMAALCGPDYRYIISNDRNKLLIHFPKRLCLLSNVKGSCGCDMVGEVTAVCVCKDEVFVMTENKMKLLYTDCRHHLIPASTRCAVLYTQFKSHHTYELH